MRHSISAVHIEDCVGCSAVVAQWQSAGGSSQRCPGFDSKRLLAFSLYFHNTFHLYFCLLTSKSQCEARCPGL